MEMVQTKAKQHHKNIKRQEFTNLLYVLHTEPIERNEEESYAKSLTQTGGDIGVACCSPHQINQTSHSKLETYFLKVSTTEEISEIFKTLKTLRNRNTMKLKQFVLLEGAPGIGKTTVAEEIAYQWASGNILGDIELVVLVRLKELNIGDFIGLESLMKFVHDNKDIVSKCANYFINETQGEDLMILLDGYDELSKEARDTPFIKGLLNQSTSRIVLPKSTVILTSRSYTISHLHQNCDCRVEIMGFTDSSRDSYLKNALHDKDYDTVKEHLENHLITDSLCYSPLNIFNLVELQKSKKTLPKTQTELTEKSILLRISNDIERKTNHDHLLSKYSFEDPYIRDKILMLAKFSYEMIEKERIVFTKEEILNSKIKIDEDNNVFGLLQSVQYNDTDERPQKILYSFVHFSIQEYLAAYHLTKLCMFKQSRALDRNFSEPKYCGIWRMYTGITKGKTWPLQLQLSQEGMICAAMRFYILGKKFPGVSKKLRKRKASRLQLYLILQEAPNNKIMDSFLVNKKSKEIDLHGEYLELQEMEILGYFIAKSYITKNWECINLSKCGIDNEGFKIIQKQLTLEDGRKKPDIKELNLAHNKLSELKTLFTLAHLYKINHLFVSNNLFNNCRHLSYRLNYISTTLKFLDISFNEMENHHIEYLCDELSSFINLEKLMLNNNKIDDQGIRYIIKLLAQLRSLKEIECQENYFSNPPFANSLIQFTIFNISFKDTSISFDMKNQICNFIIVLGAIKDVSSDKSNVVSSIEQTKSLSLACNYGDAVKRSEYEKYSSLADAFCFLKRIVQLTSLNLSGIQINTKAGHILTEALHIDLRFLNQLFMNGCGINSEIVIELGNALLSHNIVNLHLCANQIDDKALESLVKLILCLKDVKYGNNKFTNKALSLIEMLTNGIQNKRIDFCNHYYVIRSFINILDQKLLQSVNNRVKRIFLLLGLSGRKQSVTDCPLLNTPQNVDQIDISQIEKPLITLKSKVEVNFLHLGLSRFSKIIRQQFILTDDASYFFQYFYNISHLNLSGTIITESAADNLVKIFDKTLQSLMMNNCKLNSKIIMKFIKVLQCAENLKKFHIIYNNIDDDAAETLINAIIKCKSLRSFKVKNNRFKIYAIIFILLEEKLVHFSSNLLSLQGDYVNSFIHLSLSSLLNKEHLNTVLVKSIFKVSSLYLNYNHSYYITQSDDFEWVSSLYECVPFFNECPAYLFLAFENLKVLSISGIYFEDEIASGLCVILHNLQVLTVIGCVFRDFDFVVKCLIQLVDVNNIESFKFCENYLFVRNCYKVQKWSLKEYREHLRFNFQIKMFNLLSFVSIKKKSLINFTNNYVSAIFIDDPSQLTFNSLCRQDCVLHTCLVELTFHTPNVTMLNLSGVNINEQRADDVIRIFVNKSVLKFLQQLVMNKCNLSTQSIKKLLHKLKYNKNIKEVQFCDNQISDKATKVIILCIYKWKSFELLKVDNNNFTYDANYLFNFVITSSKHHASSGDSVFCDLNNTNLSSWIRLLQYMKKFSSNHCLLRYTSLFHKQLNSITTLCLSGSSIDVHKVNIIFSNSMEYLTQLQMNDCNLNSETIAVILSRLSASTKMEELQISNNNITDEAINSIINAILQWRSFEILTFENNPISSKSEEIIESVMEILGFSGSPDALKHTNVKDILNLLFTCKIETKCISKIFCKLNMLTILDMSDIHFKPEYATIIANALDENLILLHTLNLSQCNLSSSFTIQILKGLNKGVRELNLSRNKITSEAAHAINVFVSSSTNLERLYLSHNNLGNDGVITVAKGLVICQNLQLLDVSYNGITNEATESLFYTMKQLHQCGSLSSLNVHDYKISQYNLNYIYYAAGWKVWLKYGVSQLNDYYVIYLVIIMFGLLCISWYS